MASGKHLVFWVFFNLRGVFFSTTLTHIRTLELLYEPAAATAAQNTTATIFIMASSVLAQRCILQNNAIPPLLKQGGRGHRELGAA